MECLFILKTLSRAQRATKVEKFVGFFSENAPLLRLSGVTVVFLIFRWPFFFIANVVRMRIGIHSYACSQLAQRLSRTFNDATSPRWSEN